jgi:hypothetical protein
LTPATGVIWMQVRGVTGTGMLLQPMVTRTFDRFEVSVDYSLSRLGDENQEMPSTVANRLGASAQYQVGRIRVSTTMTLDLVAQGGIGLQHLVRDHDTIDRPDLSVGLGFRMLDDIGEHAPHRILFGMELGARLIAAPRPAGGTDLGCVIAFGVPLGR